MKFKTRPVLFLALAAIAITAAIVQLAPPAFAQKKPQPPKSTRLYVFDCGSLTMNRPALFNFTKEELGGSEVMKFALPCYLIVNPKGTLMWDTGLVPDSQVGTNVKGGSTVTRTLKSQMAEVGYAPSDITYLALSHMHSDHTANANDFAGATWLVHQTERDAMFAETQDKGKGPVEQSTYNLLKTAKTKILTDQDYDVFGDGTAILQYTPGHTPGHQVLFLKLEKSGPILLAGDLYHLPQERTMKRFPTFEFNKDQSAVSREKVEAFVKKTGAQLWIEHDMPTFEKNKKSPDFYE